MSEIFSVQGILALLLGGLYGAIFGAIPGLTATLAIALFIPIAFFLDPAIALPAIIAISSVAIFAGDVGSTVARIPGTPASAAYFEKLFALSRREGPLYSLGLSAMGSAVGGIIGALLLMLDGFHYCVICSPIQFIRIFLDRDLRPQCRCFCFRWVFFKIAHFFIAWSTIFHCRR